MTPSSQPPKHSASLLSLAEQDLSEAALYADVIPAQQRMNPYGDLGFAIDHRRVGAAQAAKRLVWC